MDITGNELLMCLKEQGVSCVERFVNKSIIDHKPVPADTKTVLLQFDSTTLPRTVDIGYMRFNIKQYIPPSLRCYKCNRFGHILANCRSKERCSKCGGEHKFNNCEASTMKCVNCNGNHTAASKSYARYQEEIQVLKIKNEKKITYLEAAKQYSERTSGPTDNANAIQFNNNNRHTDEFSPLPTDHALPTHCAITNKDRTMHLGPTVSTKVMTTKKKKFSLMWNGMNFFIYKTKMGLIFNFVKKKGPPPNDFFPPHFSFFGHLLPTVSYCRKLCTDKFMRTMLLVI